MFLEGIIMRLRRLEFAIIGITLAFACFMGGYFTGRSWNSVNIVSLASQNDRGIDTGLPVVLTETPAHEQSEDNNTFPEEINDFPEQNPQTPQPQEETVNEEQAGMPRSGDGKININIASQSELTDLPGIGNTLASRIVDYRRQYGDFNRIEDIKNVSGIGEKRFEAIQELITVE